MVLLSNILFILASILGSLPRAWSQDEQQQQSYTNPTIPGWHSDPSCTQVDGLFYCVTSTFISFPGLPVYASKDLINWRLASHVWNRESQLPGVSWATQGQQDGMYAATMRYHEGEFFVICEYLGVTGKGTIGVLFRSSDPFNNSAWSDPVTFEPSAIDPDLFWDDDGTVYMATHGILLQELDIRTGAVTEPISIWNGTGGVWPEGPHIYKRDGWYYLMIAEGGTGPNHSITIARSRSIDGPYEGYEKNPILTNRGTDQYFQNIGHGDLFQDVDGNWWGQCLGVRSGPSGSVYPMGRETSLFNVTWEEGEWPELQPVRGRMHTSLLPPADRHVPGDGPFNADPDDFDFTQEEACDIPAHFVYWRVPRNDSFSVTSDGLEITPTRNNLTGHPLSTTEIELTGQRGLAFIGRRQTHTLFSFHVDVSFQPREYGQEAGVTVFLTQVDHIDLGLVRLSSEDGGAAGSELGFRFRADSDDVPAPNIVPVPQGWENGDIRLQIDTANATHYHLSAMPAHGQCNSLRIGTASADIVTGGNGSFVGSLLGAYATCNGGGSGVDCPDGGVARIKRWVYEGIAQQISASELVPVDI